MGKRKMHGQTYFQCDWTGLPMRQTNCYMPGWAEGNNKLVKTGSYCCWEAVVAHAEQNAQTGVIDEAKLHLIQEHINTLVGAHVSVAPHWSRLSWFARGDTQENIITSPEVFLDECCRQDGPIAAVRIPHTFHGGTTHEVLCSPEDTQSKFTKHLTRPFSLQGPVHEPQCFQTVKGKGKRDADLTVIYWPFKNGLPYNNTASTMFKMQIYGDALLVQQSKEPCFLPRTRYVNYFQSTFTEQFATTKKKAALCATLSESDYALAKQQMASELQQVEDRASSLACAPGEIAKGAVLPPPSGKELADLLRASGQEPPPLKKQKALPLPPSPL